MYEIGFYWVKVAHFQGWDIGYFNGKYWSLHDDQNEYENADFNVIFPHRILPPTD